MKLQSYYPFLNIARIMIQDPLHLLEFGNHEHPSIFIVLSFCSLSELISIKKYIFIATRYMLVIYKPTISCRRLWRKNRSKPVCPSSLSAGQNQAEKCCRGVDLNRNFGFHWAGKRNFIVSVLLHS